MWLDTIVLTLKMRSRWLTETKVMPLKEQTQQVWLHVLNCSLHCLGIQSKLPCSCSYSQCSVLSEDMGIFRSCCVGFLWRTLSFQPAAHSLRVLRRTTVSIVYVYVGWCNKMGVTFQIERSHCVSCLMVRSQPAGSAGIQGDRRGTARLEGMPLIRQRGCWHQGRACPTTYEVQPLQAALWAGPLMRYLGRPIFTVKK